MRRMGALGAGSNGCASTTAGWARRHGFDQETSVSKAAKRARNAAVIELLCERFPQTFNRGPTSMYDIGLRLIYPKQLN